MTRIRAAIAGIIALLTVAPAAAQVNLNNLPTRTVVGRLGTTTGPAQAIPFATLAAQLLPGGTTNVDSCGAVHDGTTDDAGAIRTCAATVAAAGGGIVEFSCNATYLLGSFDSSGNGSILHPYSNVTYKGCGDSTVLKVKSGLNTGSAQYLVFYPPDATNTYNYSNIGFRDFKIDGNGANNTSGTSYQNVFIGCNYCTGVLIDNVTFANNPWSQYVQIGNNSGINASQVRITNNRFLDACDIINASCTDHSSIFIVADTYSIISNNFYFSSQSAKATAIEMHGISGVASANAIEQYSKSANIVAQVGHTGKSLTFIGNSSTNVRYGVQCWALNSQTLTDILISNNTFLRSVEPVGGGVGFLDCGLSTAMTNANSTNIKISDNVISSAAAVGTAMTDPVIVMGRVKGLDVSNNKINTSNGPCIGDNGNTLDTTTRWTIKGNTCIDTGATSTAGSRRGILINSGVTIDTINIAGNRIENVASTYMTTGIDITLNVTYGVVENSNQISNVATPSAVSGTGYQVGTAWSMPYSPGIGQPFGNVGALGSGQIVVGQGASQPLVKTLSGDTTLAASGAMTIANNAVSYAKFQQASAGNVVLGNATAAAANYAEQAMPSCSTAASALKWTTNTGFGCNTSIDATNAANVAVTATAPHDAQHYIPFANSTSGNQALEVSTNFSLNPAVPTLALGVAPDSSAILKVFGGSTTLTGTNQFAMNFQPTFSTAATLNGFGIYVSPATVNSSFTMANYRALYIDSGTKGAGSTITNQYQLFIKTPTLGGTLNYALYSEGGTNHFGGELQTDTFVDATTYVKVGTKVRAGGSAPALTSCGGGSPAITGSDLAGEVTMGTTATGCVITFNAAYSSAPYCTVTWQATPLASQSYTVSTTAITTTQTSTSGNKLNYVCMARSGG